MSILPLTNESEAFIVAEKIRINCEQQGLSFTSSFGICAKKDSHRFNTLVHDADQALYQSNTQGRNQFSFIIGAITSFSNTKV